MALGGSCADFTVLQASVKRAAYRPDRIHAVFVVAPLDIYSLGSVLGNPVWVGVVSVVVSVGSHGWGGLCDHGWVSCVWMCDRVNLRTMAKPQRIELPPSPVDELKRSRSVPMERDRDPTVVQR